MTQHAAGKEEAGNGASRIHQNAMTDERMIDRPEEAGKAGNASRRFVLSAPSGNNSHATSPGEKAQSSVHGEAKSGRLRPNGVSKRREAIHPAGQTGAGEAKAEEGAGSMDSLAESHNGRRYIGGRFLFHASLTVTLGQNPISNRQSLQRQQKCESYPELLHDCAIRRPSY